MIKALYTLLALSLTSPAFSQAPGPQVQVELKIIEIDEKDYDELMAELKATKGAPEFWEKVQKFPGADLLSAPSIELRLDAEFSKLVEVNVPNVPNATIPVFNSRKIQSNLILTDGVPAVMGGLSSDGRRTLIICTAKLMKDTVGD